MSTDAGAHRGRSEGQTVGPRARGRGGLAVLLAAVVLVVGGGCISPSDEVALGSEATGAEPSPPEPLGPSTTDALDALEGFVVWESNRTGAWRLWIRSLDGDAPRQLVLESSESAGQQQCCPHISPAGTEVLYLSRRVPTDRYPKREVAGELMLVSLDGGAASRVADLARPYGAGHRAAVWVDSRTVHFVDGEGRAVKLDLATGERSVLVEHATAEGAWLVDASERWATTAVPTFSVFEHGRVLERPALGGCEPYFSHDGRWGYWIAGAGGPIRRFELESRQSEVILAKNDRRLGGQGYLYFPMLSRDGTFLAFGASDGTHDHFGANYDVFVVPTDPTTLEPLGDVMRITDDPATDRYPDLWVRPLALGRVSGEAPLAVALGEAFAVGGGDWEAPSGRLEGDVAVFEEPGLHTVRLRDGSGERLGQVLVRAARPPQLLRTVAAAGGADFELLFDEAIAADGLAVAVVGADPRRVESSVGSDPRRLELHIEPPIEERLRLLVSGLQDRAQRPNEAEPFEVEMTPPAWPSRTDGLLFLWRNARAANLVTRADGTSVSSTLEPHGRALFGPHFEMRLRGGRFEASAEQARALLQGFDATNELTLELLATAERSSSPEPAGIVMLSSGADQRRLGLIERSGRVEIEALEERRGEPLRLDAGELPRGVPTHWVLTFTPGRLRVARQGEIVVDSPALQGDYFGWREASLLFGQRWPGIGPWQGRLEAVAAYDRVLTEEEVVEDVALLSRELESRSAPPPLVVRGRLLRRAETPTLREISPYTRALALFEYAVEEVESGSWAQDTVVVATWVLLDSERLAASGRQPGEVERLVLEPFAAHPELEEHYLARLGGSDGGEVFYDVGDP